MLKKLNKFGVKNNPTKLGGSRSLRIFDSKKLHANKKKKNRSSKPKLEIEIRNRKSNLKLEV